MSGSFVLVALVVVLAFGLLVIVHELGHFAAARAFGMRVERFSVGFGPVVLRRAHGGTEYVVSALPFGGYVRIAGMAPGDDVKEGDQGSYSNQPAWRRFVVILAGPVMNWAAAILLAFAMVATLGFHEADPSAALGTVVEGSAAARAGLREGDRILAVDGKPLATWGELVAAVVASPGRPLALEVERPAGASTERLQLTATPDDAGGRGKLGVGPSTRVLRGGPAAAAAAAVRVTNARAAETLAGLGQMFTGRQKAELRGPVGIAQEMARSARAGAGQFLTMVWFISIMLAIFNLLPIPALDGGRLVFLGYEIVTRRRVNQRVESVVHFAGFVALFGLILAVTVFGDLARILGR
jgi:regulator of sigma E protease